MVGKNNRGMTAHNGTMFDDRQPIQQAFWQYAAEEAGRSSTEQPCSQGFLDKAMCLDAESPGKTDSDLDFIQAATGEDWQHFVEKEAFALENGGVVGHTRGKKPLFCVQRSWLGQHLAEKQPVKVCGVCRVI